MSLNDAVEADAIEQLLASEGWKLYRERLKLAGEQAIADCVRIGADTRMADVNRGRIAAFVTAENLPATMLEEFRGAAKVKRL